MSPGASQRGAGGLGRRLGVLLWALAAGRLVMALLGRARPAPEAGSDLIDPMDSVPVVPAATVPETGDAVAMPPATAGDEPPAPVLAPAAVVLMAPVAPPVAEPAAPAAEDPPAPPVEPSVMQLLAATTLVEPPAPEPAAPEPATVVRTAAPRTTRRVSWGWLAGLLLTASAGLLTMVAGDAMSRTGREGAEAVFWAGFLLITLPVAARLAARAPTRMERVLLVVGVGVMLYASKALHDPFAFVYADEAMHLRNAEEILRTGALFPENSLLPVTVYYPGLGALTAGLAELGGLSPFAAGLIVIGAARVIMMLALFLLFERLSGSARVAGLAGLVYCANPNFLFWSSQYSYQSLALPLAVLAILAVALREKGETADRRYSWILIPMLVITAVAMTHHLTAYALAAALILISVAALFGFGRRSNAAWGLGVFALVVIAAWLVQVAPLTGDYLTSIFTTTFDGIHDTLAGSSGTRQLFESSEGTSAPAWERYAGLASVGLIALALPFGLWHVWRKRSRAALLVVLALAAGAYLAILPLRLVPSAWETANRASDFLFVGIALTVALAARRLWRRRPHRWVLSMGACACIGVMLVGGAIAGWPPTVRLSQPYHATVNGHEIEPQGVALARWSLASIGPDRSWAADESNARLLLAQGRQLPLIVPDWRARALLEPIEPASAAVDLIRSTRVTYAVIDQRAIANDNLAGYFFAPRGVDRAGPDGLIPAERISRLDIPSTDRLFDSGDIVVYDVWRIEP